MRVSRFSFGTASLHHVGSTWQQRAHLEAAVDAGFSHFDTAPLYGFGAAEQVIGQTFGSSSNVTVATKIGLYPPGASDEPRFAMMARKIAGRVMPTLSRAVVDWNVARARESFETSLRRLRRDWIDLLLLHEPRVELLQTDEWAYWLESLANCVGVLGVAGPEGSVAPFLEIDAGCARVVQTQDSLEGHEADFLVSSERKLQFTYGYLSRRRSRLSAKEVLIGALKRNTDGSVVISTRSRPRILEISRIASEQIC